MRKLYPDNEKTQEIYNQDENRATKQDIQDLSNQITGVDNKVDTVADDLSSLQKGLAETVNTNAINANTADINSITSNEIETNSIEAGDITGTSADIDGIQANTINANEVSAGIVRTSQGVNAPRIVSENISNAETIATKDLTVGDEANIYQANIQNLNVSGDMHLQDMSLDGKLTSDDVETENLTVSDKASVENLEAIAAEIDELKADEIAIENIHWKSYQTYTGNDPKLFMVLPHFENGVYCVRAVDGNQVTLFAVEVFNSIDNLFARWSQKEMNWVYKISKVGTGAATQCMLEIHNVDATPFTLEFATICATENVPGPTTYTTQPFPGNPMYKVAYQDGNKFFQNVDLANEGTTGSGLTKYATSNHALATQYYNYDGTMGVMDYDYLPDQSLNKADDVEFYGLQVHDFETENLDVPGNFKSNHIYDGPALTPAQTAALPDDTLLIGEAILTQYIADVYSIVDDSVPPTRMSNFFDDEGTIWKWSTNFAGCAAGGNLETLYPTANIEYFNYGTTENLKGYLYTGEDQTLSNGYTTLVQSEGIKYLQFDAFQGSGSTRPEAFGLIRLDDTVLDSYIDANGNFANIPESAFSYKVLFNATHEGYAKVWDSNGDEISLQRFWGLQPGTEYFIGDTFEDSVSFMKLSGTMIVCHAENLAYTVPGTGTTTLSRKTTKGDVVQVKPLIPFNDDGTSATDDRPLVYDSTDDTIKKATGDLSLPGDVAVAGDLSVAGDTEYTGDTTFNGDVTIGTATSPKTLTVHGDASVHDIEAHTITANDDVFVNNNMVVSGDLEVRGTTFSSEVENVQSDGDWMVLRANNPTGLANGDYAGIVFHKYNAQGKDASITVDNSGTFRLSTQTDESVSPLLNTWLVDEQYFTGNVDFSQATLFSENYPVTRYSEVFTDIEAYKDSSDNHYFYDPEAETIEYHDNVVYNTVTQKVELAGNVVSFTPDPSVDTPHEVHFYTSISFMEPQASDMEPILTRDEEADMTDGALMMWDGVDTKAKTIAMPTMNNQALTAQIAAVVTTVYRDEDNEYYDNDVNPTTRPSGTAGTPVLVPEPADIASDYEGLGFVKYAGNESEGIPAGFYYFDEYGAMFSINQFDPFVKGLWDNEQAQIVEGETWDLPNHGCVKIYSIGFSNNETTYQWKSNVGGGGLSFVGTRAQYETARLIPEGQDGYIGPNTLVTLTDEDDFLKGLAK